MLTILLLRVLQFLLLHVLHLHLLLLLVPVGGRAVGPVLHPQSGRLGPPQQEVGSHVTLALYLDGAAALQLVRVITQHVVHVLRHL